MATDPSLSHPTLSTTPYKTAFLQACLAGGTLSFGSFTLKSGRKSPYFFNAGAFYTGSLFTSICTAYAYTIVSFLQHHPSIHVDVLFGPAYKGISLVAGTLIKLASLDPARFGSLEYSYNRKEAKHHGEGGSIAGAPLKGKKILVIDDVVTAGTAIRETMATVTREGGEAVGCIFAVDRMEKMPAPAGEGADDDGMPRLSAIGEIRREYGVPCESIATLEDLIVLLRDKGDEEDLRRLEEYRRRYMPCD